MGPLNEDSLVSPKSMVLYMPMTINYLKALINFPNSQYLTHVISDNDKNTIGKEPTTLCISVSSFSVKLIPSTLYNYIHFLQHQMMK